MTADREWRWRWLVAGAGYLGTALAGVLLEGTVTEPLFEALGSAALVVALVLSAAVAASWLFLAAGIPLIVVTAVDSESAPYLAILEALFSAPFIFAALAAGVALGRRLRRSGHRPSGLAGAMAACIAAALALGGLDAIRPPVDKHPDDPLVVDWRKGTYEGIALRSRSADMIARVGKPQKRGGDEPSEPIGEDYHDIGGPTSFGSPGHRGSEEEILRYEDRAYFATDGRISGWVTASKRAETPEGVGVGDARDLVTRRYPRAECYTANEGTEYVTFPLCEVRVCSGRLLAFGGDPIKSVWLVAETNKGWTRCRRPTAARSRPHR